MEKVYKLGKYLHTGISMPAGRSGWDVSLYSLMPHKVVEHLRVNTPTWAAALKELNRQRRTYREA